MYLMHALRNFGASFRLPEHITPTQAAKILGLEGMVRGAGGSAGPPQVGPSSQGYNPAQAYSGNGSLQGPQQYPQQAPQQPQQTGGNDWEATGGMSPSQQQAVQEMTALGFSAQQSQVCLLCSHSSSSFCLYQFVVYYGNCDCYSTGMQSARLSPLCTAMFCAHAPCFATAQQHHIDLCHTVYTINCCTIVDTCIQLCWTNFW